VTNWSFISRSAEQTSRLGEQLGALCPASFVVLLEGDLGSGKTSFVQGIAKGLDVPEETPVNSPTYTLMNHYHGRCEIYHFDLYRLGSPDELIDLDFDSYLHGAGVTIVEWAGMVESEGVHGIKVNLDYGEAENERSLLFSALDHSGETVLAQLAKTD